MPTRETAVRIACAVLAVVLVVGAVLYFITGPSRARKAAAVSNATAVTAQGQKAAAQDAIRIVVDNQAVHGRIDVITTENERAIRNAPGASDPVAAGVHHAGRAALCLRDAYRLQPACQRLLDAGPGTAAPPDTGCLAPR